MRSQNPSGNGSASSCAACDQHATETRSLSIIRPSMSKMTASGRNGSAAKAVMGR